jgi:hypothetical protein
MTGAVIVLFLVLVPLTGLTLWYRQQPTGNTINPSHGIKRTPHTMRKYDPIARQRAYYKRRLRLIQEQHAMVILALLTMKKAG